MAHPTHLNELGEASMVDVSGKSPTAREARAEARMRMTPASLRAILEGATAKGDVLAVARVAGIQAAKRTSDLIPLCHPLPLAKVAVDFTAAGDSTLAVTSLCRVTARTGVEMEALTAVSVAALTVYDMLKSSERGMTIENIGLVTKSGGKSGPWRRPS